MDTYKLDEILGDLRNVLEKDDLDQAKKIIEALKPADQADLVEELGVADQVALLTHLDPSESADVMEEMKDDIVVELAEQVPLEQLADILDEMESDEVADILVDLPSEIANQTLQEMEAPESIIDLMRYPADTAGGLMTSSVFTLNPGWTNAIALNELREHGSRSESTHYLFVIDEREILVGVVGLKDLVTTPIETQIEKIMEPNVISVLATEDQEQCAQIVSRYSLTALPVIDEIGRFLGVITADDLLEVAVLEGTEDMYRMVGISGEENVFAPAHISIVKRLPWLAINIITLFIAISVVDAFEAVIAGMVVLATFLPIVSGEGGNAGSQTATVIVRGIAMGEVKLSDTRKALFKEILVATMNGLIIGLMTASIVQVWKNDWRISFAICIAMVLNFIMAALTGVLIPMGLKKINVDPALASAAFVTAFTDTFGFLFFLGIFALIM